jgi:hypothetical protein
MRALQGIPFRALDVHFDEVRRTAAVAKDEIVQRNR